MKTRTIYLLSLSLVITFVLSSCKNDDDVIIQEEERAQTVSPAEKKALC